MVSGSNCYMYASADADTALDPTEDKLISKGKESDITTNDPKLLSLNKDINFSVFPNPAQKEVHVLLKEAEEIQIRLINVMGQTILEKCSDEKKTTLELVSVPGGHYFLEVTNAKEKVIKRLTIQ